VEELKKLLKRLAEEDRDFLRSIILEVVSDGGAEELVEVLLKSPRARARLAAELAAVITIPLNVATKEDLERFATKEDFKRLEERMATKEDVASVREEVRRLEERMATKEDLERFATKEDLKRLEERMATKEDIRRLENKMATKEQVEDIALSLEEVARDYVVWFLKQRGVLCRASRLRLDGEYEFDVYCAVGGVTVVGEVKLRASAGAVERLVARVEEAVGRWPEKFQGRVVKVFYCMDASPEAVEKARELGVWLIEASRELTPLPL